MKLSIFVMAVYMLMCSPGFSQEKSVVAASAEETNPLITGQTIPDVNVKDIEGNTVSLLNLVSSKPTILIFYRGGWCPYCNTQLSGIQKIESELLELGYQIVAISADSYEMLSETLGKNELKFTLLSDNESNASTAFGLAFKITDEYNEKLKGYNIDLEKASGNNDHILPVPAVYILNTSGLIEFDYTNPDYKIRLDADELLVQAKNFQSK